MWNTLEELPVHRSKYNFRLEIERTISGQEGYKDVGVGGRDREEQLKGIGATVEDVGRFHERVYQYVRLWQWQSSPVVEV
jgi:hypothetical protein